MAPSPILHLTERGPGQGETLVVALPRRGWLVLDGAGERGDFPAHAILDAYSSDEPIDLVLLTHPHADHHAGVRAMLERDDLIERIAAVGCVAKHLEERGQHTFAIEAAELETAHAISPNLAGGTRGTLERIRSLWAEAPAKRLDPRAGQALTLSTPSVTGRVLAPTKAEVDDFFKAQVRAARTFEHANDLSAVIELRFDAGRYIFGADLPERSSRSGAATPGGWCDMLGREVGLATHSMLKLPHHGSDGAQPDGLLRSASGDTGTRVWAVTPFNGSRLPSFDDGRGVHRLLALNPSLHLTALPVSKRARRPVPAKMRARTVRDRPVKLRGSIGSGVRPVAGSRDPRVKAVDGFWLFGFDRAGVCVRRARGSLATELVA